MKAGLLMIRRKTLWTVSVRSLKKCVELSAIEEGLCKDKSVFFYCS